MRLGFNFTLPDTYDMVRRMNAEGHIDYVELLIDNFLCVPPSEMAEAFPCPVGFHIMFSRFFESDLELSARFRAASTAIHRRAQSAVCIGPLRLLQGPWSQTVFPRRIRLLARL